MSGKANKKSRRIQAAITEQVDQEIARIEKAKHLDREKVINEYNRFLIDLPLWERVKFSYQLLTAKWIEKWKIYMKYWVFKKMRLFKK